MKPGPRSVGPATCEVEICNLVAPHLRDGLREVSFIEVPAEFRGQGYGRQLMDELTLEADEHGIVLFVSVDPYHDSPLDQAALRAWYERNGFVEFQAEPLLMARMPDKASRAISAIAAAGERRIQVAH